MSSTMKNVIMGIIAIVSLALIVIGQKHISASGLIMELVGLTGLLTMLFVYNGRYK